MANPHLDTPWTEDRIEELKRLWAAGYSASDIAKELAKQLGEVFSRCAVLGKINRLGLMRRRPPSPRKPRSETVPRGRPIVRRPVFIAPVEVKETPVPDVVPLPAAMPRMRRLQLVQLAEHHCRWPFGDPMKRPFYFCAADVLEGKVYCPYHFERAFVRSKR